MDARFQRVVGNAGITVLALATTGLAMGLGGARPFVLLILTPAFLLGAALLFFSQPRFYTPAPVLLFFALCCFSLFQAAPLPLSVLSRLSPTAADIWTRALRPLGESMEVGALSLDPSTTSFEALKWFCMGLVLLSAILVAETRGTHVPALVVFGSACVTALVTIGHGLFEASSLFGLYEPRQAVSRWHLAPLLNPNNLSGYLNLGAFAGLGLAFSRRLRKYRWPLMVAVEILLGTSILTGSRGGVLALLAGCIVLALVLRKRLRSDREPETKIPRAAIVYGTVLGAACLAALAASDATFDELFSGEASKVSRLATVFPLIADFPVFGVGRGAFESVFSFYDAENNRIASHPENLPLQWISEWGIPVAILALAGLWWSFRPAATSRRRSAVAAGAFVGIFVLLGQNLLDLGLELPAVGVLCAWALGATWDEGLIRRFARVRTQSPLPLLAGGVLLWIQALAKKPEALVVERERLRAEAERVDPRSQASVAAYFGELRRVMQRQPAEPYYSRLGAQVSLAAQLPALPWVQRALERCPTDGRSHLLAARALQGRQARDQALLELRLATTNAPGLAELAGRYAAAWSSECHTIERAATRDLAGATLLVSAAAVLGETNPAGEACLRAAIARAPKFARARVRLGALLLHRHLQEDCQGCLPEAEQLARSALRLSPEAADGALLMSRVLVTLGRWDEATTLLADSCTRLEERERTSCLRRRFELVRTRPNVTAAEVSEAAALLLHEACSGASSCESLALEIGDELARIGEWLDSLAAYERAARDKPTASTLLRVARAASKLERYTYAELALARAERLSEGDAKTLNLIAVQRSELASAHRPLGR